MTTARQARRNRQAGVPANRERTPSGIPQQVRVRGEGVRAMSKLRAEMRATILTNIATEAPNIRAVIDAHVENMLDDLMADLAIHGIHEE